MHFTKYTIEGNKINENWGVQTYGRLLQERFLPIWSRVDANMKQL